MFAHILKNQIKYNCYILNIFLLKCDFDFTQKIDEQIKQFWSKLCII